MSAPLQEFLSEDSRNALLLIDMAIGADEQLRHHIAVIYPGPMPEPMTLPPPVPQPVVVAPHKNGKLVRLKIDREHVEHLAGDMCPGCDTQRLVRAIVLWPGGKRPAGGVDVAWWCKWCRQYYVEA